MNLSSLIDTAGANVGSLGILAQELGKSRSRISEWKSGKFRPDANEIAYLADKAGLPVIETLAEVEAELNPQYAAIWKKAVRQIRQNQG